MLRMKMKMILLKHNVTSRSYFYRLVLHGFILAHSKCDDDFIHLCLCVSSEKLLRIWNIYIMVMKSIALFDMLSVYLHISNKSLLQKRFKNIDRFFFY